MSRSYKKTPISGICGGGSNKQYKKQEHQAERSNIKRLLRTGTENLPHPKEYGNEWSSPRDGKTYFGDCKDQHWYNELMRK